MRTIDHGGWGRQHLTLLAPASSLADVVEMFWVDEWHARPRLRRPFRIVADDAPHLIWHLHRGRHRRASLDLVGARSTYRDVDVSSRLVTVGVRLRPGVLPLLTGDDASRFTDRTLRLDHVLRGRRRSPEAVIDALATYLDARRPCDAFAKAARALDPLTGCDIRAIAERLAMSERSLRNASRAQLGMGLKRFLRIRRLHAAFARITSSPATWSRVAAESGYADQAHLIRDCRALLGETPAAFLRRAED